MLATGGADDHVRLWDTKTGDERLALPTSENGARRSSGLLVTTLAFSPDGQYIAAGGRREGIGGLYVWEARNGKRLNEFRSGTVTGVIFSQDGKTLIEASDSDITLWGMPTARVRLRIKEARPGCVVAVSWNGRWLVASDADGKIRLFDMDSGRSTTVLEGHSKDVVSLAVSPDDKLIASASSDGTVRLWDVKTGREVECQKRPYRLPTTVVFSPDGKTLATGWREGRVVTFPVGR